jgi:hypothetical protein
MNEKFSITNILKRKDILLLVIVGIVCMLLFRQCSSTLNLQSQLEIQNLNLDALNDTVRVQKNKAGEDMFVKKTLLANKESLEKLNSDLAVELKKVKGQVIALQKVKAETKTEIQYVPTYVTKYNDGKYSLDWKLDTTYSEGNYRKLSANSYFEIDTLRHTIKPGNTKIGEDVLGFSFVTGLREKDNALEIFVTPKYPGMTITSMEGAIIDPHKSEVLKKMFPQKKWSIGPFAGVGIGAGVNFIGKPIAGPVFVLGIGVQYSIIKF